MTATPLTWHVLDVRNVWVREVARTVARDERVIGWLPQLSWCGALRRRQNVVDLDGLDVRRFPLQRGFARRPVTLLVDESVRMARRLAVAADAEPAGTTVLFCSPHYHPVAARWPGPKIYYASDMFRFCGDEPQAVERHERAMCEAADLVCPNSRLIAEYMTRSLGVPSEKLLILPNAARAASLLPECPVAPAPLPADCGDLDRPVAGVIGNLAINTDWLFLESVIDATPWLSWVFVGPSEWPIADRAHQSARARLLCRGGRVRFVGERPFVALREYARAFDVAMLPYRRREPTWSGSATRFFEHLAACRPMLATRGVHQLLDREPLVRLVDTAEEAVVELDRLRGADFRDGHEERRWRASRRETLESRVAVLRRGLALRGLRPGVDPWDDHGFEATA